MNNECCRAFWNSGAIVDSYGALNKNQLKWKTGDILLNNKHDTDPKYLILRRHQCRILAFNLQCSILDGKKFPAQPPQNTSEPHLTTNQDFFFFFQFFQIYAYLY